MSVEGNPDLIALIGAQMEAAMSKLEVRLIDRFASKKEHDQDIEILSARLTEHVRDTGVRFEGVLNRVGSLEQSRAGAITLSAWQRWFFGGLAASIVGALIYVLSAHSL